MTPRPSAVTLTPVTGMPEVAAGDDLGQLIADALQRNGIDLADGDVLVVSSKVVSKALGLTAGSGDRAGVIAAATRRVVAERLSSGGLTRIVESAAGPVMAAGGVDASNTGSDGVLLLLPEDPDQTARDLRSSISDSWAAFSGNVVRVGLILSDTAGRPWRVGQTDFALGAAGMSVIDDLRGALDADGRDLAVTIRGVADEVAAAADLVKGKADAVPVAHVRGLVSLVTSEHQGGARDLIRTGPGDWFRLGHLEAVRAALGVVAGSQVAQEVGVASVLPEPVSDRVRRAVAVALHDLADVAMSREPGGVRVTGDDAFEVGVASARLTTALRGEGVEARIAERREGMTPYVSVLVGFDDDERRQAHGRP